MADWTSLLDGLNAATLKAFGREVLYSPQSGEPVTFRAVFQPSHETEENAPGIYGVIFVQLRDFPQAPARGDHVTVDLTIYKVYDIEADGSGGAVLRIRQA